MRGAAFSFNAAGERGVGVRACAREGFAEREAPDFRRAKAVAAEPRPAIDRPSVHEPRLLLTAADRPLSQSALCAVNGALP